MVLKMGAYGLAWAQSTVAVIEVVILFVVLEKRIPHLFDTSFVAAVLRMIVASTVAGIVCYLMLQVLPFRESDSSFFSAFPKFMIIAGVSFLAYGVMSRMLKLPEVEPIIKQVNKFLFVRLDGKRR